MTLQLAGIALTVFSDRYRGHAGGLPTQVKRILQAFGTVAALGFPVGWNLFWGTVLLWMGMSWQGYGNAVGPASTGGPVSRYKGQLGPLDPGPEMWQVGPLLNHLWLGLIVYGIIWTLPVTIYAFHYYRPGILIMPIAMMIWPLSCAFGQITQRRFGIYGWTAQQWYFGILMAVSCAALYMANITT